MVVLLPDENYTIAAMSDAYLKVTMTSRGDIINRGMFEVFPGNPGNSNDSGTVELRHSLDFVRKHGKPHTMALVHYSKRRHCVHH